LREQFEGVMKLSAQALDDAHALRCEMAAEVLRSSGSLRLPVTGWSMLPTVWPGDTLAIEQASSAQVCKGDIVLFSSGRRFVAHRVVAIGDGSAGLRVQTQGDATPSPDAPLAASDLLGKVSFILREGKAIEPSQRLRFSERAVAAGFRHSSVAARVVVRVRGMIRRLHGPSSIPTPRIQTSRVQTASL
jgi:signal peptidase I